MTGRDGIHSRRGWAWGLMLALPLALLAYLLANPGSDLNFSAPWFHFYVVSITSFVAFILALLVTAAAGPAGDIRAFFVTLAFTGIAAIFLLHGLATPGVLIPTPNQAVIWSTPISLFVGAVLFALAMAPWPQRARAWILAHRAILWAVAAVLYLGYAVMAFAFPAPLEALSRMEPAVSNSLAGVNIVLFAGAAIRPWQAYRHTARRSEVALAMALILLAESVLSMIFGLRWHLSWWLYHLLMVAGFVVAVAAVVLEYETVRDFRLVRYFAALGTIAAAFLALVASGMSVRLLGGLVLAGDLYRLRWTMAGLSLGVTAALLLILLGIVRRADRLLAQRATELQRQRVALERARMAEALARVGLAISATLDLDQVLEVICEESLKLFRVDSAFLWLVEGDVLVGRAGCGQRRELFVGRRHPLSDSTLLGARVIRERRPRLVNHAERGEGVNPELVAAFGVQSILGVPMLEGDEAIGALILLDTRDAERFTAGDVEVAIVFGQQAAIAVKNARLYTEVRHRLLELSALFELSVALRGAKTLDTMFPIILDKTLEFLEADSGALFLIDGDGDELVAQAARGIMAGIAGLRLPLRDSLVERAITTGETEVHPALIHDDRVPWLVRSQLAGQASGITAPMYTADEPVGALSLIYLTDRTFASDQVRFLDTIAALAGTAIQRAALHEETVQQAEALSEALSQLQESYQATLAALSAALDARDRETEGHSQRVAAYALTLARALGVEEERLQAMEWGALLHDVGKVGVPDAILHKPGSLTTDERARMQRHPELGHDILEGVPFLRDAMPIILYHHERWDGTGYPCCLAREEIPLPARIFAVADALDAITTDRPYRQARPFATAREEIRRGCGTQFDPRVVEAFLSIPEETWLRLRGEAEASVPLHSNSSRDLTASGVEVYYP